jgi:hypothetical protein
VSRWRRRLPRLVRRRWSGPAVAAGGRTVTPLAERLELHLPWAVAAWAFPVAVEVETADGSRRTLPVRDVTRLVQGALLAAGLLLGGALAARRRSEKWWRSEKRWQRSRSWSGGGR